MWLRFEAPTCNWIQKSERTTTQNPKWLLTNLQKNFPNLIQNPGFWKRPDDLHWFIFGYMIQELEYHNIHQQRPSFAKNCTLCDTNHWKGIWLFIVYAYRFDCGLLLFLILPHIYQIEKITFFTFLFIFCYHPAISGHTGIFANWSNPNRLFIAACAT